MSRRRADLLLVERGFFDSRAKARAAIEAGLVRAGGEPVRKAADMLDPDAAIEAQAPHPWVSRGGVKLAAALDAFGIDPSARTCLDCGASTGGFTQVLLARGAAKVYAVDVGRGQLHRDVAGDARVVSLEGTDARTLDRALVPDPIEVLAVDVSFISLRLVLPPLVPLLAPGAWLAALIKPQFEAGRAALSKGGIVRDEAVRTAVCQEIEALVRGLGFQVLGLVPSPIAGGDGNVEFLIGARLG
ncbi:TlyA family RNA methyltransferase [Salinarimonas soli]|uniref:TlyA family RNA methyltransferase n=1 Tax=Salinarimonas soli TaxID=1638099 RepID=A0A5B2VAP5_9HYPH|nr:TlyA family RNA methyltransferase [Salinarimonas soli]KAA2235520.1 TlyA family RNA methyltransferase [Salinarimonas soli]